MWSTHEKHCYESQLITNQENFLEQHLARALKGESESSDERGLEEGGSERMFQTEQIAFAKAKWKDGGRHT